MQPCFTQFLILNESETLPSYLIVALLCVYTKNTTPNKIEENPLPLNFLTQELCVKFWLKLGERFRATTHTDERTNGRMNE